MLKIMELKAVVWEKKKRCLFVIVIKKSELSCYRGNM